MLNNSKVTITDADVNKLRQVFATRTDLKKLDTKFVTKKEFQANGLKVQSQFKTLIQEIKYMRSDFTTKFDQTIGEVKIMGVEIKDIKTDIKDMKIDMQDMKTGMQDMKTGMKDMKTDIKDMKTGMKDIKTGMKDMKIEMRNMRNDSATMFAQTMGKLKSIGEEQIVSAYQVSDARDRINIIEEKISF